MASLHHHTHKSPHLPSSLYLICGFFQLFICYVSTSLEEYLLFFSSGYALWPLLPPPTQMWWRISCVYAVTFVPDLVYMVTEVRD